MTPAGESAGASPAGALPLRTMIGFGIGSLGTGVFSTVPSILLLYFMTSVLAVPAGLAALTVFLPKFWDVLIDPGIGMVSDRTRSRWGRRRPYMLAGAIGMAILFVLLFSVPDLDSVFARFLYVTVVYMLCATAYAVFSVPYIAMPAEISRHPDERTTLMSFRMGFAMVGILLGGAGAPLLVEMAGGGRSGYAVMALVIGVACGAAMLVPVVATRRLRTSPPVTSELGFIAGLRQAATCRPFVLLMVTYLIQLAGLGCFSGALPYYAVHIRQGTGVTVTLLFVALNLTAIAAMPLWTLVSRRIGKGRAYLLSSVMMAGAMAALWLCDGAASEARLYGQIGLMGLAFAGQQLFPFALLPDVLDADARQSGVPRQGMFTGLWTAGEKLGLALGGLFTGGILSVTGFIASSDAAVVQPASALAGVQVAFSVLPAVLVLVSLWPLLVFHRHVTNGESY